MVTIPLRSARKRPSRGRLLLGGLLVVLALFGGCRSILSLEEREYDPVSCDAYCRLLQDTCTDQNRQYASLEACLGLCSTLPMGSVNDASGDTVGCRIHLLEARQAMIEDSECAAAGPGGNGVCGTNCESYCIGMQIVCPQAFQSQDECLSTCSPLLECGLYAVSEKTPNDPSLQCRLYHLSAAAVGLGADGGVTDSQRKHCPHAAGQTECIPVDGGQCP